MNTRTQMATWFQIPVFNLDLHLFGDVYVRCRTINAVLKNTYGMETDDRAVEGSQVGFSDTATVPAGVRIFEFVSIIDPDEKRRTLEIVCRERAKVT